MGNVFISPYLYRLKLLAKYLLPDSLVIGTQYIFCYKIMLHSLMSGDFEPNIIYDLMFSCFYMTVAVIIVVWAGNFNVCIVHLYTLIRKYM